MITILLADKQPAILKGLHMNLSLEPDIQIVGSTSNSRELLALCQALQPDVVILDVDMLAETAGQKVAAQVAQTGGMIIAHSLYDNQTLKAQAIGNGAKVFVVKQGGSQQLLVAIRRASR
jgi:DNA-binding NarL/FixJ family response regulator